MPIENLKNRKIGYYETKKSLFSLHKLADIAVFPKRRYFSPGTISHYLERKHRRIFHSYTPHLPRV